MKRLPVTDKIKEKMSAVLGTPDFKPEDFAFYEVIAINDLPVSKMGSLYDGSRMTEGTLQAMVDYINKETFLPLHTLHQQGRELPVGRAFSAELNKAVNAQGKFNTEVRTLFYIPLNTDKGKELSANIDNGIINEVSIGASPQQLKCSGTHEGKPCGFDYMGDNTFMNWLDQTCSNGHTIGKDGIHAIFDGLRKFYEFSLVSIGAADHARIVEPSQAITAANDGVNQYQLLYATKGKEKENAMKLTATQIAELRASLEKDGKRAIDANFAGVKDCLTLIKDDMTLSDAESARALFKDALEKFNKENPENVTKVADKQESANLSVAEVIDLKADMKNLTRQVADLTATITAKDEAIATLNAEISTLKANKVQLDALTAEVTPVKDFLTQACQNLLVATGAKNFQVPTSLTELVASIKITQASLSKLPVDGLLRMSESGSAKPNDVTTTKDVSAFKVKKD